MTAEDKLQEYILSKYKSIMQFAKFADIPYTTVKGIFTRGIWGTSVQNIIKICDILSIDINELVIGNIKSKTESTDLSDKELELIVSYRNHPELQTAINKLLGITDTENVQVLRAARSDTNENVEYITISKDKLEQIRNAKSVENEDDL